MVVVVVRAVVRVVNMIVAEVLYLSVYLVVRMEVVVRAPERWEWWEHVPSQY